MIWYFISKKREQARRVSAELKDMMVGHTKSTASSGDITRYCIRRCVLETYIIPSISFRAYQRNTGLISAVILLSLYHVILHPASHRIVNSLRLQFILQNCNVSWSASRNSYAVSNTRRHFGRLLMCALIQYIFGFHENNILTICDDFKCAKR